MLAGLVWFGGRWLLARGRRPPAPGPAGAPAPRIDLASEETLASQLPEDEWMRLAREQLEAGDSRLAVRALFLAILSSLGEQRLIDIDRAKSNLDYRNEVRAPRAGAARCGRSVQLERRRLRTCLVRLARGAAPVGAATDGNLQPHQACPGPITSCSARWRLVVIAGFAFGLRRLFALRFEAGDVYADYSTLNTGPRGARALS